MWLQTPHQAVFCGGDLRECEHEKADFLAGMSAADALRVEADRAKLLDLKLRLLHRLATALAGGRVGSLWADILRVLTGAFTATDIKFYAGLDRSNPIEFDPLFASDPRSSGGLIDWLDVAGHVEQELAVGAFAATRTALTGRTRKLLHDMTRGGPDRDSMPPQRLYLALHSRPERASLDAAINVVGSRQGETEAFWAEYGARAGTAFERSFRVVVPVAIGARHADQIRPLLPSFATYAEDSFAAGRWPAHPSAGLYLFRRDNPTWTIAYEGKILGKPHAVGLVYLRLLLEHHDKELDVGLLRKLYHRWTSTGRPFGEKSDPDEAINDLLGDRDRSGVAPSAGNLGEMTDDEAADAARKRAAKLPDLIAEATSAGEHAEAGRLREELRRIGDYLKRAHGLGGRRRRVASTPKNDRDAVVKAINETVKGFEKAHPALHKHLMQALTLGSTCCYRPPVPINWQF